MMYASKKYNAVFLLPTHKEMLLCIEAYYNGKSVNFKSQTLYKHNASFKRCCNGLVKFNVFRKLRMPKQRHFCNQYALTADGLVFVESVLRHGNK